MQVSFGAPKNDKDAHINLLPKGPVSLGCNQNSTLSKMKDGNFGENTGNSQTNIDSLEKALEIMRNTSDAMTNTMMETISYKESYNKDGISFDINGQGLVKNLKFSNGTPPSMIENAINSTIEKMKLHFEEIYFNNLPLDIRQPAFDASQEIKAMLKYK